MERTKNRELGPEAFQEIVEWIEGRIALEETLMTEYPYGHPERLYAEHRKSALRAVLRTLWYSDH